MPAARCAWCNRPCTPDAEGYCSDGCKETRERLMARYPEVPEHDPRFGVDWEGFIYFAGAFFDELRGKMGESDPVALAFVMGRSGDFDEWCRLLEVPDKDAVVAHLMAQWGIPYLEYGQGVKPPDPPRPVSGKSVPRCVECGKEGVEHFNRRGDGYRSYCRDCEAKSQREYRLRRKAKLQENAA